MDREVDDVRRAIARRRKNAESSITARISKSFKETFSLSKPKKKASAGAEPSFFNSLMQVLGLRKFDPRSMMSATGSISKKSLDKMRIKNSVKDYNKSMSFSLALCFFMMFVTLIAAIRTGQIQLPQALSFITRLTQVQLWSNPTGLPDDLPGGGGGGGHLSPSMSGAFAGVSADDIDPIAGGVDAMAGTGEF